MSFVTDGSQSAIGNTQPESTVGHHQQVPIGIGTCGPLDLAVLEAQLLLAVSEERLDAPAHRVRANQMHRRCVDLVRHEVLHWVLFVLIVGHLLGDQYLLLTELRDRQLLRPDFVGLTVDLPLGRVDALSLKTAGSKRSLH